MTINENNVLDKYRLDDIDRALIKHMVAFPGTPNTELAKVVGIASITVALRIKKPAFKRALADQMMSVSELTKKGQELAVRRLIQIVQGKDDKLALEAAKILMFPILSRGSAVGDGHPGQAIVFKTRIGPTGEVIRLQEDKVVDAEVIVDGD